MEFTSVFKISYPFPNLTLPPDDAALQPRVRVDPGPSEDGAALDADSILDHNVRPQGHVRADPAVGPNLGSGVLKNR